MIEDMMRDRFQIIASDTGGAYPILGDPNYPDKTIPDDIKGGNVVYCIKDFVYVQDGCRDQITFKENKKYKVFAKLITGIGLNCEPIIYMREHSKETLVCMFVQIDFFNEYFAPVDKMRKLKIKKLDESKSY